MADFSADQPGRYVLQVPGLGRSASLPDRDPRSPAAAARTYALGLLHQRAARTWSGRDYPVHPSSGPPPRRDSRGQP